MAERQTISELLASARAGLNRLEPEAAVRANRKAQPSSTRGAGMIDEPLELSRGRFISRYPYSSGASTRPRVITTPTWPTPPDRSSCFAPTATRRAWPPARSWVWVSLAPPT